MAVRKIAVISANTGNFDKPVPYVPQSVPYHFYLFDDHNFPVRTRSMIPRLQARIPKCFGWQMVPGYDYYLWVDSSCALLDPDSIKWFVEQLGDRDFAFFKHPHRNTIGEEAAYLKKRLAMPDTYITSRYAGELIDEQMAEINDPELPLYASTAFIYRNTYGVQKALKEWWYHISRYHIIDQLGLPYALKQSNFKEGSDLYGFNVIQENFMKIKYLSCVRK